jgi:hypothetical protein
MCLLNDHLGFLQSKLMMLTLEDKVYIGIIDRISQELDTRFDEVNMELLSCMTTLNPSNSFALFDAHKVRRLAEFYHNDFSSSDLLRLKCGLITILMT